MDSAMQGVHRVKLYKLDTDGNWMDRGTGQISVAYLEQSEAMGLIVVSEDTDGKTLLVHKLCLDDIYQRQGDATIISWSDKEVGTEVAVSFENTRGCQHIWAQIKQVQEAVNKGEYVFSEEEAAAALPLPEIGNLEEIAKIVCGVSPSQRERLAGAMLRQGWITTLLDVFKQCEDLEDVSSLGFIFRIVRGAIMLNDPGLLEELLKEDFVMDVVGALEQDPELGEPQKHRGFLSSSVVFKEVVPIRDPALLAKIHQTYRIQYIKDVILPRSLDDSTYATLSSLALFNNVEVVSALANDADFLTHLFTALEKADPGGDEWGDLVAFMQEFCNLARHLQQTARAQLFGKLVQLGLFEQVTRIMKVGSETTKLRATDVLLAVMQHDTVALSTFLQQQKDHVLFSLLVREFTEGLGEGGLCEQVAELLKMLLDPDSLKEKPEKSEFVDLFYDKFMGRIVDVIISDKAINPKDGARHVPASTLGLVVDFMCFCVLHHAFKMKYYMLRNHTLTKVVYVIRRPERWLACAAVRFIRTCVNTKDPFYVHQLVKQNLFDPVMSCFFQNGDRYNLLNSATLELVDYITQNNIKELIKHLVEQYGSRFEEVDYVDTFIKLRQRHEQHQDAEAEQAAGSGGGSGGGAGPGTSGGGAAGSGEGGPLRGRTFAFDANGDPQGSRARGAMGAARKRWDERQLSRDEEDYFETEEEEAGNTTGSGDDAPGPLPAPEGPYPRPRRPPGGAENSPPGSPKRGRPVAFGIGPSAKRRAGSAGPGGSAPSLSIFSPATLADGRNNREGAVSPGEKGSQGSGQPAVAAAATASPVQAWLGLTEYEDDDPPAEQSASNGSDQQQQQQQPAKETGTGRGSGGGNGGGGNRAAGFPNSAGSQVAGTTPVTVEGAPDTRAAA